MHRRNRHRRSDGDLGGLKQKVTDLLEQVSAVQGRIADLDTAGPPDRYAVVERSRCTGCGLCEQLCPVGAVRVTYV
ncbi:MAG: 4Fe-4S binding protein, partial [Candidatus Brocadiia bacterium]